jgi:hypothetical protein
MKGKKLFPNKNHSDIFFTQSSFHIPQHPPQPNTHRQFIRSVERTSLPDDPHPSMDYSSRKSNYKRNNFSVDESETKFRDKLTTKLKEKEADIVRFRKRRDNISFLFPETYYQQFINVKPKNSVFNSRNATQVTYEVTKTIDDNKTIDAMNVKRSFTRNGINMYKVYNCTSGLTPVFNDKLVFSVQQNDEMSNKFKQIKKTLEHQGLKLTKKTKQNYDKSLVTDIFPAKTDWENPELLKRDARVDRRHSMERLNEAMTDRSYHKRAL